jgi:phage repressor protein C with HTH and peptisase S24 domain
MNIYARRRTRLAILVENKAGGNVAEFARTYGYSRSQISQFLSETYNGGRSIGERAARNIDEKTGNPPGWLDLELSAEEQSRLRLPFSNAELRVATSQTKPIDSSPYAPYIARIPIVAEIDTVGGTTLEGQDETKAKTVRFLEYYSMHALQAMEVRGWGLRPRIKSGEFLVINPEIEPFPGDDVMLTLKSGEFAIVQFLHDRQGELTFGTLNEGTLETIVRMEDIESLDVIVSIAGRDTETFAEET